MPKKPFRQVLEDRSGVNTCEFLIPNILLPPRFQEISQSQNMILCLDRDLVVHIRWEGQLVVPYHPLTPGAVRRLVKEVLHNLIRYRKDLTVAASFIDRYAESPSANPREDTPEKEKNGTEAFKKTEEIVATVSGGATTESPEPEALQMREEDLVREFNW